ncbi:MAG: tRNA (adenosine(37)-N6)-dimethylallyltransferase MiaA [Bacteroidetes bacterium HGW-Bacteroidetes-4]|jgi:tRNA dimethylallyltransferase|nr:MAG: tRNA (adenosine(37)-N6)-dimethylallyltransferase MiaA [Bacteroidetes bacterium HGW-Bacteroidetes-4]
MEGITKKNIDLITVLGPTASGKTSFAVHLAHLLNAQIISADSRQVYRGMDLGTGKDLSEYTLNGQQIPYHLIDIVDAGTKYNVYEFQNAFLKAYQQIIAENSFPILCGGSGMYIEAVLKSYRLTNVPENEQLRKSLEPCTLDELTAKLAGMKQLHNTSDIDTKKRAIRAIEIESYYKEHSETDLSYPKFNALILGIKLHRQEIKQRITERLKQRLRDGMIDEVEQLIKQGVSPEALSYYGLEYKFIVQYLQQEYSYNTMIEKLNIAIHQFAKRQMTWFRRMERGGLKIHWIDGLASMEEKIHVAMSLIQRYS